jgi:hypothetical protein
MSIFNIIFIDIGIIFTYLIAKELYGKKVAVLSILLFIVVFSNYLSYYVICTDTFSIPFISGSVYLIIKTIKCKDARKKLILSIFCAASVALGYLLKPYIVTVIIALAIVAFSSFLKSKKVALRQILIAILSVFVFFGIVGGFYTVVLPNQSIFPYDKSKNGPMSYTVAQNISGIEFSYDIYALIGDNDTAQQNKNNIEFIKHKLKEYGIKGFTRTISKSFRKYVSNIPGNHEVKELQKTVILDTAHILRKVIT